MGELKARIGPNTAHLCIDMQRLFSDEGPWPMAWTPRVTPKVEQLVARAPERTIFTRILRMVVADKVRENDIQEIFPDAGSVRLAFGSSSFPQCRNQKLEVDRGNRKRESGK